MKADGDLKALAQNILEKRPSQRKVPEVEGQYCRRKLRKEQYCQGDQEGAFKGYI